MKNAKTGVGKLKRKMDVLFSNIVRSHGECEMCGSKRYLQCAHMRKFWVITILIAVVISLYTGQSVSADDPVLSEFNHIRGENDLPILRVSSRLSKSAQTKACDMNSKGYWDHTSPEGVTAWDLIEHSGYDYSLAGEILAKNCTDGECVKLWMESPAHEHIIMEPNYKEFGIGRCGVYTVVHFGTPFNYFGGLR